MSRAHTQLLTSSIDWIALGRHQGSVQPDGVPDAAAGLRARNRPNCRGELTLHVSLLASDSREFILTLVPAVPHKHVGCIRTQNGAKKELYSTLQFESQTFYQMKSFYVGVPQKHELVRWLGTALSFIVVVFNVEYW